MRAPLVALLSYASGQESTLKLQRQDLVHVVEGVALAFFQDDDIKIEPECVQEVDEIPNAVNKALGFFALLNAEDALLGLKELSEAMDLVRAAIALCKAPEEHLEKLSKAIAMIRDPTSFAYTISKHIIVDGVEMKNELTVATHDWETQHYEDFGMQLGLIFNQILVGGVKHALPRTIFGFGKDDAVEIFKGITEGLYRYDDKKVEALVQKKCVQGERRFYDTINNKVLKLLRRRSKTQAKEAFVELSKMMMLSVYPTFSDCEFSVPDLFKLRKALWFMERGRFEYIGRGRIKINGKDITGEWDIAVSNWPRNYNQFGLYLGKVLKQLSPPPVPVKGKAAEAVEEEAVLIA